MEELTKEQLQERYKELAQVDKVNKTWGVNKLTEEIKKYDNQTNLTEGENSGTLGTPSNEVETTGLIKGNCTDVLPDDHPYKDYSFENVVAVKGTDRNGIKTPDIMIDQWYHIYLLPQQGNNRVDSPRKGWTTKMDLMSYQNMVGRGTKGISHTYHYDEVIILHDPTK